MATVGVKGLTGFAVVVVLSVTVISWNLVSSRVSCRVSVWRAVCSWTWMTLRLCGRGSRVELVCRPETRHSTSEEFQTTTRSSSQTSAVERDSSAASQTSSSTISMT